MPPRKGTKAYKEEYTYVHIGIDMNSLGVETVWERRDGGLSKNGYTHHTMPGRSTASELIVVFNLTDTESLPVSMYSSHGKAMRERVEAKAEEKRRERDAAKESKPD